MLGNWFRRICKSRAKWRPSTRYLPPLASARRRRCCVGGLAQIRGHFRGCGGAAVGSGANERSFEELDFRPTPMGVLSLRRRRRPMSDIDVYEIKLGDEFLMSSQFTVAEIELARLGLAALARADLDVVVGGLGLGYTARAVLEDSTRAIADRGRCAGRGDRMARAGPASARQGLTGDPRCRLVMATSSRCRIPPKASIPLRRGAVSMRCWWTSITRRENCCILATPRCRAGGACAACRPFESRRRFRAVVERSAR